MMKKIEFEYRMIPLAKLEADSNQPRRNDGLNVDKNRLFESIKDLGIQQPLAVTEQDNGERYIILDGHRRYKCAKELGLSEVPCCVYQKMREGEFEYLRFELQNNRRSWSPIERSTSLKRIREGLNINSYSALAKLTHLSKTVIANSLGLLKLNIEYLDLMNKFGLNMSHQYEFVRLVPKLKKVKDLEVQDDIIPVILEKVKNKVIRSAKDLRDIGTAFRRTKTNEDVLHDFFTTPDMTVADLDQRLTRGGYLVDGENLRQSIIKKLSQGDAFSDQEKKFLVDLIKILKEVVEV